MPDEIKEGKSILMTLFVVTIGLIILSFITHFALPNPSSDKKTETSNKEHFYKVLPVVYSQRSVVLKCLNNSDIKKLDNSDIKKGEGWTLEYSLSRIQKKYGIKEIFSQDNKNILIIVESDVPIGDEEFYQSLLSRSP